MNNVVSLSAHKEKRKEEKKEQEDLLASLHELFKDLDRAVKMAQALLAVSHVTIQQQDELRSIKMRLHLACTVAVKLKLEDPIMDRARKFYANPSFPE